MSENEYPNYTCFGDKECQGLSCGSCVRFPKLKLSPQVPQFILHMQNHGMCLDVCVDFNEIADRGR